MNSALPNEHRVGPKTLTRDLVPWTLVVVCLGLMIGLRVQRWNQGSGLDFPSRALTIICPFSSGGGTDLFARGLARAAEPILGQTVLVNNITGGGGAVGHAAGLLARPDGYTITAITFELVSLPLQGLVPFKHTDFDLLMRVNMDPAALTVRADCPANTVEEFIAWAREKGGVQIGNSGPGSVWHMAAAMMADELGLPATHVPYGGAAPAVTSLVGGHIDAVAVSPGEVRVQRDAGLVKILAVMSTERLALAPDAPTFRELGHDLVFGTWRGLAVPKETPLAVRERLTRDFRQAMESPEFLQMAERGALLLSFADAETFGRELDVQSREVDRLMDRLELR